MLDQIHIEAIMAGRLPESQLKEALLNLVPEKVNIDSLSTIIKTVVATLDPKYVELASLNPVIDCSGTGGSGLPRFNTSTTVAFVLAAAGLKVTKFGNRAASGRCGSFDLLSSLGFPETLPHEAIADLLEQCNVVFLFAPQYYPTLAKLAPIRQQLGVPTILNFIGPLLNPVSPQWRLMGVSHAKMQELIADYVAQTSAINRCLIVRSDDGLDEIGLDQSKIFEIDQNGRKHYDFKTPDLAADLACLCAGKTITYDASFSPQADDAREIFLRLLKGEDNSSHFFKLVCANAGAGLYASAIVESIAEGMKVSAELLQKGAVLGQFQKARRAYANYS